MAGYYQIGPAIMWRQEIKLHTVALTAATAAQTGLLLSSKHLPLIGASTCSRRARASARASRHISTDRATPFSQWLVSTPTP